MSLNGLQGLEGLNPDGSPPPCRLKDAESARSVWEMLRLSDSISAFQRARFAALYDCATPYSESELQATGQSYRVNIAWPFAPQLLDTAQAGYVDIINSVQVLFECPTTAGNPDDRPELEQVVAEEVTNCIRSWREFNINFLQLTSLFIKEAVGVSMFRDQFDWRWDAYGFADFKIPRKSRIGQENVDVACFLRFYSMTELYQFIKDPEIAEKLGYNVEAIKKTILRSVNNSNTFTQFRSYEWEKLEVELRNNDYFWTYGAAQTANIRVIHMFWTEFDGRTTCAMISEVPEDDDFLYLSVGQYKDSYEAYTIFTYGVGTNGFYHGIRGQGYIIYPIVQALNRAYCQSLELAMFGSAPLLQPKDESAMEQMQFTPNGPYNLITPGIDIVPNTIVPNLSQGLIPTIQEFTSMLKGMTANAQTEQVLNDNTEKTKFQVQAELGAQAKMSVASMNLFYDPFETLMREMVRRMKRKDYAENESGGSYIVGLHKRLLDRGNGSDKYLQAFYKLDVDRLKIKKAIGSGSEAARLLALDRVMSLFGSFDPTAQQMLLREVVSSYMGWREADRLVPPAADGARPDAQASIAELQNDALISGGVATVKPNDNHFVHAQVHLSALVPMIQQVEQGMATNPLALAPVLQGMNALNQHATEHIAYLSANPLYKTQAGQMRKIISDADEVIHNSALQLGKLQRKAMEAQQRQQMEQNAQDGAQPQQQGPQIPPDILAKIEADNAMNRAKIQMLNEQTQAKIAREQAQAQQRLAIEDASAASRIRNS